MSNLKFTTESPTEPGWYWRRASTGHRQPVVVEVHWYAYRNDGGRYLTCCDGFMPPAIGVHTYGDLWAGPIAMPAEEAI